MSNLMFETYCRVFNDTDIVEARRTLGDYDLLHEEVGYFCAGGKLTRMPVDVLMSRFTPCTKVRLVHIISFIGGPPGQQRWYSGTLLTYLLDRILWKRHMRVIENGKHLEKV
jgi:hypothetical protein